jgi:hypothetical protein
MWKKLHYCLLVRVLLSALAFIGVSALLFRPYDGFQELWFELLTKWILNPATGPWLGKPGYMVGNALVLVPSLLVALFIYHGLTWGYGGERAKEVHTRCRKCGYILKGLKLPRCSECGEAI